jgi:hypothetical protein
MGVRVGVGAGVSVGASVRAGVAVQANAISTPMDSRTWTISASDMEDR